MVTEIREFGDNRTIVLYTDEKKLATRLKHSAKCFKAIEYEQEQAKRKAVVTVAMDLYFPKRYHRWLDRQIKLDTS